MDMQAATKRIDAIVDGLLSLKQELLGTEPEVPQQTIDRKQRNQCVKCGKSMRGEENPWRSCHSRCAQAVNRRIKAGKLTDRQAIELGEWGPPEVTGRPAQVSTSKIPEVSAAITSDMIQLRFGATKAECESWLDVRPLVIETVSVVRMSKDAPPIKASVSLIQFAQWGKRFDKIREIMLRLLKENRSIQIKVADTEISVQRIEDLPLAIEQVNRLTGQSTGKTLPQIPGTIAASSIDLSESERNAAADEATEAEAERSAKKANTRKATKSNKRKRETG